MMLKTTQTYHSNFKAFVKSKFKSVSNFGTTLKISRNTAMLYANCPWRMNLEHLALIAAITNTSVIQLTKLINNEYNRHQLSSAIGEGCE
jgi:hypothetical protein